jgi:hypothetical protein
VIKIYNLSMHIEGLVVKKRKEQKKIMKTLKKKKENGKMVRAGV